MTRYEYLRAFSFIMYEQRIQHQQLISSFVSNQKKYKLDSSSDLYLNDISAAV